MGLIGLAVINHQPPSIALKTRPGLSAISDESSVRRILRRKIGRRVVGGYAARIATLYGHDEDVAALGFLPAVPVSIEKAVGNLRSHLALRSGFLAPGVALVIAALGID